MLRASSIVVCYVVSYNRTECRSPSSYFSSYSGLEDGIETRLGAGWPEVRKKEKRGQRQEIILFPKFQDWFWGPSNLVLKGYR